jgi:hypothetical protein
MHSNYLKTDQFTGGGREGGGRKGGERERVCVHTFLYTADLHTHKPTCIPRARTCMCVVCLCMCVCIFTTHTHTHTHTHTSGPYGTGDDFVAGGRGMFGDYAIHALWCVS